MHTRQTCSAATLRLQNCSHCEYSSIVVRKRQQNLLDTQRLGGHAAGAVQLDSRAESRQRQRHDGAGHPHNLVRTGSRRRNYLDFGKQEPIPANGLVDCLLGCPSAICEAKAHGHQFSYGDTARPTNASAVPETRIPPTWAAHLPPRNEAILSSPAPSPSRRRNAAISFGCRDRVSKRRPYRCHTRNTLPEWQTSAPMDRTTPPSIAAGRF